MLRKRQSSFIPNLLAFNQHANTLNKNKILTVSETKATILGLILLTQSLGVHLKIQSPL